MPASYVDALRLDGKGFIVFGVGEGLGRQSCLALREAGAEIVCVDVDPAIAARTAADVDGIAQPADVTKRADMEAAFATATTRFGDRFAGLVDVVGMADNRKLPEFDDAAIDRQLGIVFRHALLAMQLGGPLLARAGGGSMTFIGSMAGIINLPNQSLYGTAKAALHHAVQCAAVEFGHASVRVNAIAPGFVRTPRSNAKTTEEQWAKVGAMTPLPRPGEPWDIAAMVLFLASDLGRFVTGNIIRLDGGITHTVSTPRPYFTPEP
jgi:NAD(P)-dependent dehydrogenase (short-subunit alcohol dehydrogenase family)